MPRKIQMRWITTARLPVEPRAVRSHASAAGQYCSITHEGNIPSRRFIPVAVPAILLRQPRQYVRNYTVAVSAAELEYIAFGKIDRLCQRFAQQTPCAEMSGA